MKLKSKNSRDADFFKKALMDIQYNKAEDPFGWRQKV